MDEDYKNCQVADKSYERLLAWKQSLGPQGAMIETLRHALRLLDCSEELKALRHKIVNARWSTRRELRTIERRACFIILKKHCPH